jgi:hypothetical protein
MEGVLDAKVDPRRVQRLPRRRSAPHKNTLIGGKPQCFTTILL